MRSVRAWSSRLFARALVGVASRSASHIEAKVYGLLPGWGRLAYTIPRYCMWGAIALRVGQYIVQINTRMIKNSILYTILVAGTDRVMPLVLII